ncbi:MAG: Triosephosphate isomerase [Methanosaeta sp. PtaB.Bin039]|nr:MAG: Triosephosphate isomerase [Methanosaeta sp. PtaB.Bin039]HOT07230.1 triose-phosphate isomerase [Methanotrichaceae archaeon]HQF17258.1 triose-phosphate isomerase [Methanotrichaceae archaeon]HQI91831.1 triose-phosphate isomerase [Methanotrichaceae archaeon]HQJ29161.1 triose-phosphate isomerase [Methanotrichaceae archaeon]
MTIIVLNFKTYRETTGEAALSLSKICQGVAEDCGVEIAVAPQAVDIRRIAKNVSIPVYAQHVDGVGMGGYTGHVTAVSVQEAGAVGSLINHSERRLQLAQIEASISACKAAGLNTIICTNNVATTRAAAALEPTYVAVEPPELIGSGIAVSQADPEVVRGSVDAVKRICAGVGVLCGAGITTGQDLRAALDLGTEGVLLASGIIKAKDQRAALEDLVAGA